MKAFVSCLSVLLLVSGNTPLAQAPQTADSCHFKVSGELAKPTISGPEDITALVHVIEQPDSPVEILAIDFKDSWLSVAHERVTEQLRCTAVTVHVDKFRVPEYATQSDGVGPCLPAGIAE